MLKLGFLIISAIFLLASCGENKSIYDYKYSEYEVIKDSIKETYNDMIESDVRKIETAWNDSINNGFYTYSKISKECQEKINKLRLEWVGVDVSYLEALDVAFVSSVLGLVDCDTTGIPENIQMLSYSDMLDSVIAYKNDLKEKKNNQIEHLNSMYIDSIAMKLNIERTYYLELISLSELPKFDKNKTLNEILKIKN